MAGDYCYLSLYIFCGDALLGVRLRQSNIDASEGCVEELQRIVGQIRQRWPGVKIILRGDSGFCREELMRWCEDQGVDYVVAVAKVDAQQSAPPVLLLDRLSVDAGAAAVGLAGDGAGPGASDDDSLEGMPRRECAESPRQVVCFQEAEGPKTGP